MCYRGAKSHVSLEFPTGNFSAIYMNPLLFLLVVTVWRMAGRILAYHVTGRAGTQGGRQQASFDSALSQIVVGGTPGTLTPVRTRFPIKACLAK